MKLKNLFVYTQAIGAIICTFSASSFAFDLNILKNDKEAKSHAYNSLDLSSAKRRIGTRNFESISSKAFQLLGESFSELERFGRICDLSVVQNFKNRLSGAEIPNDHDSIVNLLILWRSQDLIDDVFFEIIEQSSYILSDILDFKADKIKVSEIRKSEALMTSKKIKSEDLANVFTDLDKSSKNTPGCSLDAWLSISRSFSFNSIKTSQIRQINVAARSKNLISESAFELAELFRVNEAYTLNITLGKYLNITKTSKNQSRIGSIKPADLKTNNLSSRLKDKKAGTSYRQSLYYRFNSMQIGMISDLLKKMFDRMDATKAELVFTSAIGTESIPISPMGQYFLTRKLLKKDMEELSRSTFFGGGPISHEDLITAALETGLINADIMDSALKIDDLWNPQVPKWKKIADFGFRVTGTATLFLPPPYNIISSIAMVFIEGLVYRKTNKTSAKDNSYEIF